ncbi:MAG TPA: trypsin-like peptidase domain-containing protein [Actinomycetospora sp.]|uniref:S1C family serine protease n=1 Tax=Actinomycetospora sp. TaxID=1872135 RepID=UPI002F4272F5
MLTGGLAVLVLLLAACTNAASTPTPPTSPAPTSAPTSTAPPAGGATGDAAALQNSFVDVVNRVRPSVVEIVTADGLGSGVIYDAQGDVVTNSHVVGRNTRFQLQLASGGTFYPATLVGTYPPDDLAVVHFQPPPGAPGPATFADSSRLQVGDLVLAMGNPLGLAGSVSDGIISATGRTVGEPADQTSPGATLPDAVQTSAPINPGNSGGALVDLDGHVVGIPTLAATTGQSGGTAAGIGFAIPSNIVTDIAGQLVTDHRVVNSHRAALGVTVTGVVNADGAPAGTGISAVAPGGPAAAAGLVAGDVITAINGTPTPTPADLTAALATFTPGQQVTLTVTSGAGPPRQVPVTLGQLPGT